MRSEESFADRSSPVRRVQSHIFIVVTKPDRVHTMAVSMLRTVYSQSVASNGSAKRESTRSRSRWGSARRLAHQDLVQYCTLPPRRASTSRHHEQGGRLDFVRFAEPHRIFPPASSKEWFERTPPQLIVSTHDFKDYCESYRRRREDLMLSARKENMYCSARRQLS